VKPIGDRWLGWTCIAFSGAIVTEVAGADSGGRGNTLSSEV
jgi:hypothetical protein